MLSHLRIRDLIVVEEATLEFGPGFNVLSGSTGAGKSVLMAALALVTGARARGDWIRPGAERAVVEAFFHLDPTASAELAAQGIDCEEGELHLKREIRADGRSQAFLGGFPITVGSQRALGEILLERQDQHEQLSLTEAGRQLEFLDRFAGNEAESKSYRSALAELRRLRGVEDALREELGELRRDEEYLRFQLEEIDALAPEPGEREDLQQREMRLRNAARIHETLREALGLLEGGESLRDRLGELARVCRRLEKLGEETPGALLDDMDEQLAELSAGLRNQAEKIDLDAREGERLAARLGKLHALERKHGVDMAELLSWAETQRRRLAELEEGEERLAGMESRRQENEEELSQLALALSESRSEAAALLGEAWEERLALLGLEHCRLRIQVERADDPDGWVRLDGKRHRAGEQGIDRVQVRVRTNPDLPEGGLKEIPSGGELSRIALARHLLGVGAASAPLLVLDEVDTGLGADTARVLAEQLMVLARDRQLVLVTHQAALAAAAERQYCVRKSFTDGRTHARVEELRGKGRVQEISRMLGEEDADLETHRLAESMLAKAAAARG